MAVFDQNPTFQQALSIRYSRGNHAVHSYLTGFRLWRQYWRQFWARFSKGHISLKNRTYCPLFRQDTSSFKNMCLLIKKKKRRMLCMGRTFTVAHLYQLNNCPKPLSVSCESNLARVKASGRRVPSISVEIFSQYNWDGQTLKLVTSLQRVVCSEVPLFCSNFNSNRSSNFTNLLITMATLHSNAAMATLL
jgi:hypothetical protein